MESSYCAWIPETSSYASDPAWQTGRRYGTARMFDRGKWKREKSQMIPAATEPGPIARSCRPQRRSCMALSLAKSRRISSGRTKIGGRRLSLRSYTPVSIFSEGIKSQPKINFLGRNILVSDCRTDRRAPHGRGQAIQPIIRKEGSRDYHIPTRFCFDSRLHTIGMIRSTLIG